MIRLTLIILIFLATLQLAAQSCVFRIDTTGQADSSGNWAYMQNMQWVFNGQVMTIDQPSVSITPNPLKFDTLLFQFREKAAWDTIICNVAEPGEFLFSYNPCCNGFDIREAGSKHRKAPTIIVNLSRPSKRKFIAILGDGGTLLRYQGKDTLSFDCMSAMSSNIVKVKIKEIKWCGKDNDCEQLLCLFDPEHPDNMVEQDFSTVELIDEIKFMPVGNRPLYMMLDPLTGKLKLE